MTEFYIDWRERDFISQSQRINKNYIALTGLVVKIDDRTNKRLRKWMKDADSVAHFVGDGEIVSTYPEPEQGALTRDQAIKRVKDIRGDKSVAHLAHWSLQTAGRFRDISHRKRGATLELMEIFDITEEELK